MRFYQPAGNDGHKNPKNTSLVLFVDKEEIGSDGATGAKSKFLESVLADLMIANNKEPHYHDIHKILMKSRALSADVNGAIDPDFQDVHEKGMQPALAMAFV